MATLNPKAITAGVSSFIVLFSICFIFTNISTQGIETPVQFFAWLSIWILPGYVSAHFSRGNGVINGLTTGAIIGAASGIGLIMILSESVRMPISKTGLIFSITFGAAILCGLGGLIWHLKSMLSTGNL
jgi:hypothetical protein